MNLKDKKFFLDEARRWIGFNTVSRRSNGPFAFYLRKKFQALGFHVRLQKANHDGQAPYNFIAWKGPARRRPLLLNTHLDTVPPGPPARWTSTGGDPWGARVRGGKLFGLGAADVKLNLLCQWEALRSFSGQNFQEPLCVVGTFGEEIGQIGVAKLLKDWRGPLPVLAFVGEPSELRPINQHRGYIVCELTLFPDERIKLPKQFSRPVIDVEGRSAHSSTPHLGVNALEKTLEILLAMERKGSSQLVVDFHGGTAVNQVPAEAAATLADRNSPRGNVGVPLVPWKSMAAIAQRLSRELKNPLTWNWGRASSEDGKLKVFFDVRYPPAANPEHLIRRIKRAVDIAARKTKFHLEVEHHNPALSPRMPASMKKFVEENLRKSGLAAPWEVKATCTEAGQYQRKKIPALVFGPGRSVGNIHRPNESIGVADLHRAVRFYRTLIESWCKPLS